MPKKLNRKEMLKRTPKAPWGRKADGSARRKPGPPAGRKLRKKSKKKGGRR